MAGLETGQEKQKATISSSSGNKNSGGKASQVEKGSSAYPPASRAAANWSNEVNHFQGLQLSSLSPSPATAAMFPTDLSSLDFQLTFGPQDSVQLPSSKDYLQSGGQNKGTTKQQSGAGGACQLGGASQRAGPPDWSSAILDNSFLPPLPTLTPPGPDMTPDPMTGYTFMSPMSHTQFYPACASQAGRGQQSYSAHSAASIPASQYSQAVTAISKTSTAGNQHFIHHHFVLKII